MLELLLLVELLLKYGLEIRWELLRMLSLMMLLLHHLLLMLQEMALMER